MTNYTAIVFITGLIFVYGLFSKISDKSPITAPMFFVFMGILLGPYGFNLFHLEIKGDLINKVTEITLVLILFVDASTISLNKLIEDNSVPRNLLLIGLPLTMIFGSLLGYFMYPDIDIWVLILMALILSPTDAALGQAVVKSVNVPEKIRRWISVESGLNDGISLPPIFACLAIIAAETAVGPASEHRWVLFLLQQIFFGLIVGALVGFIGGYFVHKCSELNWMNHTFQRLVSFSLALLCFALAELIHGNGFIAAFAGGLFLGFSTKSKEIKERIQEFGEAEGQQLILFVFLIFSMVMIPVAAQYWDMKSLIYAILSLSVIRMVPVAISLIGKNIDIYTILFIGWFGPRGIASVLYLLLVVRTIGLEGYEYILSTIVLTILISIFVHGATAVPLSNYYKKQAIQKEKKEKTN